MANSANAIANPTTAYSFLDVSIAMTFPGGTTTIAGQGTNTGSTNMSNMGYSEEGIKVVRNVEKNVMTVGADGSVMHSLRAGRQGRITVSLLKTSPGNAILNQIYNQQSLSSASWGQNQMQITNAVTGDNITSAYVAFVKQPDNINRGEGGVMDWEFDAGFIVEILGNGYQNTGLANVGA